MPVKNQNVSANVANGQQPRDESFIITYECGRRCHIWCSDCLLLLLLFQHRLIFWNVSLVFLWLWLSFAIVVWIRGFTSFPPHHFDTHTSAHTSMLCPLNATKTATVSVGRMVWVGGRTNSALMLYVRLTVWVSVHIVVAVAVVFFSPLKCLNVCHF